MGPTVELRAAERLAIVEGRGLALSEREVALLEQLLDHQGHVVEREQLYTKVWGTPLRDHDRSVDVYVHKLRAKLARTAPEWEFIHTHFGLGYRLDPVPSQAFHNSMTGPQQALA